ncbi:MAG: hypothetical protein IJP64_06545 [Oscillospiraceae bacterium]|nr:hypothetical protein [Oscillospiraceae bacterium]
MLGKQKCKILKEIRQKIADENDIPYVTRECSFQGECRGTCPRCESELRYLERELALRASLGKRVAVAALCASVSLGAAACSSPLGSKIAGGIEDDLSGMIACEPHDTPEPPIEIETGEVAWPVETEEPLTGKIAWPDEDGDLQKPVDAEPPKESAELPYVEVRLTGDVWYPEGGAHD